MSVLMSPADAAAYLGVTESRLRRMAQRGEVSHRRDGRLLRFTVADLEDYVASTARPRRMKTTRDKNRA